MLIDVAKVIDVTWNILAVYINYPRQTSSGRLNLKWDSGSSCEILNSIHIQASQFSKELLLDIPDFMPIRIIGLWILFVQLYIIVFTLHQYFSVPRDLHLPARPRRCTSARRREWSEYLTALQDFTSSTGQKFWHRMDNQKFQVKTLFKYPFHFQSSIYHLDPLGWTIRYQPNLLNLRIGSSLLQLSYEEQWQHREHCPTKPQRVRPGSGRSMWLKSWTVLQWQTVP